MLAPHAGHPCLMRFDKTSAFTTSTSAIQPGAPALQVQCSVDQCTTFANNTCTCTACGVGYKLSGATCVAVRAAGCWSSMGSRSSGSGMADCIAYELACVSRGLELTQQLH